MRKTWNNVLVMGMCLESGSATCCVHDLGKFSTFSFSEDLSFFIFNGNNAVACCVDLAG